MPGVGKILGSINTSDKLSKPTTIVKFGKVYGGEGRTLAGTSATASTNTQWRCATCKFANPLYTEDKELVTTCTRCRDPK